MSTYERSSSMFLSKGYKGFYYLYFKDDVSDIMKKVSTKTKLKSGANKFLRSFNPEQRKSDNLNVSLEYLKEYTVSYVRGNLSKSSLNVYESVFRHLFNQFGNKSLKLFTGNDIEFYKNERLKAVSFSFFKAYTITNLIKAGVNIHVIKKLAGHSNIKITTFSDISDIIEIRIIMQLLKNISKLEPGKRRIIEKLVIGKNGFNIKFVDRLRALELLGKHLGLFSRAKGPETIDTSNEPDLSKLSDEGLDADGW